MTTTTKNHKPTDTPVWDSLNGGDWMGHWRSAWTQMTRRAKVNLSSLEREAREALSDYYDDDDDLPLD